MNLSTVDRVRTLISASGDNGVKARAATDAEIGAVLATVSGAVEAYLDRYALATARTEYLDVAAGQRLFRLRAYPVTTLTGVWFDDEQSFGTSTALTSTDYYSPLLDTAGVFETKYALSNARAPRSLKISYTGGMATDTDSFVDDFPDLAGAVDTQVSHEWQRRNALGVSSVSYPDGTTASLSFDRWIPSVKQVLDHYRRVTFG